MDICHEFSGWLTLLKESAPTVSAETITATAAVITAFWNAHASRKHYRLSVRPKLKLTHRFRGALDYFGIRLVNSGLGPALIDNIVISVDGKPIENSHQSWKRLFETIGLDSSRWHLTRSGIGSVVSAGEEIWLFRTS